MNKLDRECPECNEKTLDSSNKLSLCNNCGYAPNGLGTIKCPICDNYSYKMDDGIDICDTCEWEFGKSNIAECDYRKEWVRKQQKFSIITSAIKNEIVKFFIAKDIKHDEQSFDRTVIRLYNYLFKASLPQKYIVYLSNEVVSKSQYKTLITLFKEKFERGENVIPWQSRSVLKSDYQDILFNHWNVKHLHLIADSTKRTSDILLYIQNDNILYFLDIVYHPTGTGWNNFEILRTICRNNWMQHIGFIKASNSDSNFVEGSLEPKIEDEKMIRKIYECRANMGFTIDDVSYLPNPLYQGVVASGDSQKVIQCYNELCKKIKTLLLYEFIGFSPDFYTHFGEIKYKKDGIECTERLN